MYNTSPVLTAKQEFCELCCLGLLITVLNGNAARIETDATWVMLHLLEQVRPGLYPIN